MENFAASGHPARCDGPCSRGDQKQRNFPCDVLHVTSRSLRPALKACSHELEHSQKRSKYATACLLRSLRISDPFACRPLAVAKKAAWKRAIWRRVDGVLFCWRKLQP